MGFFGFLPFADVYSCFSWSCCNQARDFGSSHMYVFRLAGDSRLILPSLLQSHELLMHLADLVLTPSILLLWAMILSCSSIWTMYILGSPPLHGLSLFLPFLVLLGLPSGVIRLELRAWLVHLCTGFSPRFLFCLASTPSVNTLGSSTAHVFVYEPNNGPSALVPWEVVVGCWISPSCQLLPVLLAAILAWSLLFWSFSADDLWQVLVKVLCLICMTLPDAYCFAFRSPGK